MTQSVKPKSWFGIVGSIALSVALAMTACGGDDGDDDDGGSGGGSGGNGGNGGNGGTSTAGAPATMGGTQSASTGGTASSTGGTASSTGGTASGTGGTATAGRPGAGGVAGRQQYPNLRKNTAPSAN